MSTVTTEVKKGTLFVKEVLARLTGDDNEALANKIARKSVSAVSGQISALEAKEIDDENTLEDAQDALQTAIYPTALFSDNKSYCQGIANAQAKVDAAQDTLDNTRTSLAFFNGLLAKF
jgi:hypothetical protein